MYCLYYIEMNLIEYLVYLNRKYKIHLIYVCMARDRLFCGQVLYMHRYI